MATGSVSEGTLGRGGFKSCEPRTNVIVAGMPPSTIRTLIAANCTEPNTQFQ